VHVVDACMMGPLIIPDEAGELYDGLLPILSSGKTIVPGHWRLEVANLGRMAVRKRRMSAAQLAQALDLMAGFHVNIDAETNGQAWTRTLDLASRHDLTAYDAAYLELAIRLGLNIVTRDGRLVAAARAENVALEFA
jgi:predicted nucleic acid-binding protein